MTLAEQDVRWASCPYEPLDLEFFEGVVIAHSQGYMQALCDRFGAEVGSGDPSLSDFLSEWSRASEATFEQAWNLSFNGVIEKLRFESQADITSIAASVALHLSYENQAGEWRAKFSSPLTLRFGRFAFDGIESLSVVSDPDTVRLEVRRDGQDHALEYARSEGTWRGWAPRELLTTADGIVLLGTNDGIPDEFASLNGDVNRQADKQARRKIDAALEMLGSTVPEYADWVRRVIRHIFAVNDDRGSMNSGSMRTMPGAIHMAMPDDPIQIAEILIHESSHQYYHACLYVMTDQYDPAGKEYYSPVRRTYRPLSGILLAYHAFGNVFLFYDRARAMNVPDKNGYLDRNIPSVRNDLNALDETISSSDALSPVGSGIYKPLRSKLAGLVHG